MHELVKALCDGCNVNDGHRHRCHSAGGGQEAIRVKGELMHGVCTCPKCDIAPSARLAAMTSERDALAKDFEGQSALLAEVEGQLREAVMLLNRWQTGAMTITDCLRLSMDTAEFLKPHQPQEDSHG